MESKPIKYKTGDLFLANRWTLSSLLTKTTDPDVRWSDVGIFIVNSSNPESINVMLMDTDGIVIEELADVLRDPTIQAAAHRSLDKSTKSSTSKLIVEYLKMLTQHQNRIKTINPESRLDDAKVSSIGSRLDAKGRDMKVSGFSKGNPDSKLKSAFTPTDLIGSVLAYAKLMKYEPDVTVKDFQSGEGLLDEWYSNENPLFPTHKLDDEDLHEIVATARADAERLILAYMKKLPVMNYQRFTGQAYIGHEMSISDDDEDEIKRRGADYPEQESNVISMAAIRDRRLDTNARGEDAETIAIEKKLRQREKAISVHAKPKPSYKS